MKKKFLTLGILTPVLITGLILSSCKKESKPGDNLVGTWTVNSANFTAMVGNMPLDQYLINVANLPASAIPFVTQTLNQMVDKSLSGTIQINSDNTYTSTLGGSSDSGTWSLSADGKTLNIISSTKSSILFNIVDLTATKMDLSTSIVYSSDLNNDGTPEVINVAADASLTR